MRIVDPATAVTFLYKANQLPPVLTTQSHLNPGPPINSSSSHTVPMPVPAPPNSQNMPNSGFGQDVDLRNVDPRLNRGGGGGNMNNNMNNMNNMVDHDFDMRLLQQNSNMDNYNSRNQPNPPRFPADPRQRPLDPRQKPPPINPQVAPPNLQRNVAPGAGIIPNDASDQEKAALIMQVLQLSDDQIAMLPPEQRTSILVLKEQIAKSTGR